jgi:hypothetical protein
LAAPKHLHAITTIREIFSKICKGGGGRREIEWGEREREAAPSALEKWGRGEEDERKKEPRLFIPKRN